MPWIEANGVSLRYELSGSGKETLVLVHEAGGCLESYEDALPGLEREFRSKSAGFRTIIMISIGACFFTIMSKAIGSPNNEDRIASNIVTGIGFLGAGVIFRGGENRVSGITTAATIWTVAAVGMGIGAGYYFAAASASVLIIFMMRVAARTRCWSTGSSGLSRLLSAGRS